MIVTEYTGSDYVGARCDRCGFFRRLLNPSTVRLLALRCDCVKAGEDVHIPSTTDPESA